VLGVRDDQYASADRQAHDDEPALGFQMAGILDGQRQGISEDCCRLLKRNSVLLEIVARFPSIPFEYKRHVVPWGPGGLDRDRLSSSYREVMQEPVSRASHSVRASVQDVGIDHGRADVLVAQKVLNRADVISVLQ
jgi:hypothetical protein